MNNISWKAKIIGAVIVVGLALMAIFTTGFYRPAPATAPSETVEVSGADATASFVSDSGGKIVSVTPDNLVQGTILPTQAIKLSFKDPIEGFDPNYHISIEPKADVTISLIDGGKTIEIKPNPTFAVGTRYIVSIRTNMKFKGEGSPTLGKDMRLEFNTLNYRGV